MNPLTHLTNADGQFLTPWRTFLDNHVPDLVGIDFFTVPTATFRVLFCFVVLRHERRRVVHFNVTTNPTAEWAARRMVEAFPFDEAPRYMIRDRGGIYGDHFRRRVKNMGIEEVPIAPRSPWQNGYVACCTSLVRSDRTSGNLRRSDSLRPWLFAGAA